MGKEYTAIVKKVKSLAIALIVAVCSLALTPNVYAATAPLIWTQLPNTSGSYMGGYAMSDDAQTMLASDTSSSSGVKLSKDGGKTWSDVSGAQNVQAQASLAVSADGNIMAIAPSTANIPIKMSHDGGKTWQDTSTPAHTYYSLAMSKDGKHLVAYDISSASFYISHDSGTTWVQVGTNIQAGYGIGISGNGQVIVAPNLHTQSIQISRDGGATFSDLSVDKAWYYGIGVSADGKMILAPQTATDSGAPGKLLVSRDSGLTFNDVTPTDATDGQWLYGASVSADGKTMVAQYIRQSGSSVVYVSQDGGKTWSHAALPTDQCFYFGASLSSDGSKALIGSVQDINGNAGSLYYGSIPLPPAAPKVNAVTAGATTISGTATPDDTVTVTFPGDQTATATVTSDGTWSVAVPAGITLTSGQQLSVTDTSADSGLTSAAALVTISAAAQQGSTSSSTPATATTKEASASLAATGDSAFTLALGGLILALTGGVIFLRKKL